MYIIQNNNWKPVQGFEGMLEFNLDNVIRTVSNKPALVIRRGDAYMRLTLTKYQKDLLSKGLCIIEDFYNDVE